MDKAKIGLIGILNDEFKKDFWAAAKRLAEIGYQGIEGPPGAMLEGNVADNVKRLHDVGMRVLCTSALRERLRDKMDEVIAEAKKLQTDRVSCWWGPTESRDQILRDAELYNKAGARLAQEGLRLAYHNHNHEFRTSYNGVYALDVLAEHTNPEHVHFVIDIAWVTFGGADPVAVINRYGKRITSLHIKDVVSPEGEKPTFTAVGTGCVNHVGSIKAALSKGIEWAVIEQDKLRNLTPWETVTTSYLYLKEAGVA